MADGARLESVCAGNRTGGSNPPLSVLFHIFDFPSIVTTSDTMKSIPKYDGSCEPELSERPIGRIVIVLLCWVLGVGAIVATRFRGQWDAYMAIHRWMAERGVPHSLRNYDSLLIYVVFALVGAAIVSRIRGLRMLEVLCIRGGAFGVWKTVGWSLVPIVLGGMALGLVRGGLGIDLATAWPPFSSGVIRAPIGEELIFRGLLVACIAGVIKWSGRSFWINVILSSLFFGSIHVPWTPEALQSWPAFLATFVGGVWYAWLLRHWKSLWVPMGLHAGMNLGWMLMGATGGAGGGGIAENMLRVATIAIATALTIRMSKNRKPNSVAGST